MHKNIEKSIFWFRQDLRLSDNPGLCEAAKTGMVLPVFIFNQSNQSIMGNASKWWLHQSLEKLNTSLDNQLNIYAGDPEEILSSLAKKNGIKMIFWSKCYEPTEIKRDELLEKNFQILGIICKKFCSNLLWDPSKIVKSDKTPYKVFTPFYRNGCLGNQAPRVPVAAPVIINYIKDASNAITLESLRLVSDKNLDKKLQKCWKVGEESAQSRLQKFLSHGLTGYKENRDFPCQDGTSRLSPHLHFGEISPNQIWYGALKAKNYLQQDPNLDTFLKEIGWREFSYNLLYNFRDLPDKNYQAKFDNFPWHSNLTFLHAWQQGQTGYPIIDAGMRELLETGYMHNRVRMIVASFLVKNLLLDWRHGRDWFWDHLVDADLANNSASWQWVAGSGADAAPYFRIFNPIIQGKKFDAHGDYTRRFVPELTNLPDKFLFEPWKASQSILVASNVQLGENYPHPIVSIELSRKIALESFKSL